MSPHEKGELLVHKMRAVTPKEPLTLADNLSKRYGEQAIFLTSQKISWCFYLAGQVDFTEYLPVNTHRVLVQVSYSA